MEQPMFTSGQRVVCANRLNEKGIKNDFKDNDLINGKTYTVVNPCVIQREGKVWIEVTHSKYYQLQTQFVPEDFDRYADNELHQALKGIPETL